MRLKGAFIALLAVTTMASASCAANVPGHPGPGLTPVDISSLKTGPYRAEPTAYDPDISSVADLRTVEAQRLFNYLVHSYEIDSDITVLGGVKIFYDVDTMVQPEAFPEKYRAAAADNNLLLGVYVSRINTSLRSRKKLIISVLRFPTDAASRKAAEDFDRITNLDPGRHPIAIEGQPDARASSSDDITGVAFVAHGPYVIMVNAGIPEPNQTGLADIIGRTINKQTARLDRTQPTPLDDVLDLPLDPDSLMRRTLPRAADFSDPFILDWDFGSYQPAGELHFERNPAEVAKALDENGVDLVARRSSIVYRARDLSAAFRLQSVLVKPGKDDEVLDPPPGLPDARCLKLDNSDVYRLFNTLCAVVYGRYVAVVQSSKTSNARVDVALDERAAAQYSVLVKSEK
ncbi:DUF7373 family lipoprotein [Nocardia pseudovaccinii]|uniref:DUF7373 family lipoprotein n=1 Tax=Nocardia pseudovaccinii TaxID=189540 RepID=UPI0007A511AB|nr:hypothetical protein [Nocardia pseudovaccinii]